MFVQAMQPTDLRSKFTYRGVWTNYISILLVSWLIVLSLFNCSSGTHVAHFAVCALFLVSILPVTYHFFHWKKGTPFSDDQGIYNALTWWEQMDNGKQLTRNRKFLTLLPVVLYLIACHTTNYKHPMLFINMFDVFVMVVAKFAQHA